MKCSKFFVGIFTLSLILTTCDVVNSGEKASNYLMFGHFYGECMGEECVEIFKMGNGFLYEDQNDKYPRRDSLYRGDFTQLSFEKYNRVKDLIDYFPDELLQENRTVIGQPDAGDWGGLYIEYNFDGVRKHWLIDQMKDNLPAYLHVFRDEVNERIGYINDENRAD